jgi:hypothetical protein
MESWSNIMFLSVQKYSSGNWSIKLEVTGRKPGGMPKTYHAVGGPVD